jgi:hypothetical protein
VVDGCDVGWRKLFGRNGNTEKKTEEREKREGMDAYFKV